MTTQREPTPGTSARPGDLQQQKYRRVYFLLFVVSLPLMLLLPPPGSTIVLAALLIASVAIVFDTLAALPVTSRVRVPVLRLPDIAIPKRLSYAVEIVVILLVLASATYFLQNWSLDQRVRGGEFSYLINSGVIAANIYHKTGAIPLWNPFMGRGEPLLENPFSFVLNPLMTLPIFWFGAIQGTKIAVLLHIALMGIGGWVLALELGLKAPSRLLLALLLGGAGSMAGAIGMGFYQMGLSQAYVPWVFAGLLGIIKRPGDRATIAIMVVAGMLLIFAGTFWYVLPTAIGGVLLVAFHAVRRNPETHRFSIDLRMLGRVAFAGLLLIGLSAVRLLPQAVHHDYIDHPLEFLNGGPFSFLTVLMVYVTPYVLPPFTIPALNLHYIIPLGFVVVLVIGRLTISLLRQHVESRWRILVPAFLLIILFTAWAQEGTPFMRWLYDTFPLLREWRFVGRMEAAGAFWIAVVAAIWLDDIVTVLARAMRSTDKKLPRRLPISPGLLTSLSTVTLVAVLVVSAVSVKAITDNWVHWSGTDSNTYLETSALNYLRAENPQAFISVATEGFYDYMPFYDTYERASFGNPDYQPAPLAPTIGTYDEMRFPPTYALGYSSPKFHNYLSEIGFHVAPENDKYFEPDVLWENPTAPSYVFAVYESEIENRTAVLTTDVALPVNSFVHNIDSIEATLGDYDRGLVLVAQEVAYPGWTVTIDGQPAPIESVGGLIGVRLPLKQPNAPPTHVVFAYRPTWLYIGGAITVISVIGFVVYVLRIDERLKKRRQAAAEPSSPNSAA